MVETLGYMLGPGDKEDWVPANRSPSRKGVRWHEELEFGWEEELEGHEPRHLVVVPVKPIAKRPKVRE